MKAITFFIVFMIVWIFGCYLADEVFQIEKNSWAMSWGYFVGVVGLVAAGVGFKG